MNDNTANTNNTSLESLYLNKDFEGAKEYILKHRNDFDLGQYHYNLGTLHAKIGDYAASRFHFEKAMVSGKFDTNVFYNNLIVKEIIKVDDAGTSDQFFDSFIVKSKELPTSAYVLITLILLLCIGSSIKFKFLVRRYLILFFLLLSILPITYNYLYLKNVDVAISLKDIQLREGPSKIYSETQLLRAGQKVITAERNGDWVFIKAPLKYAGWANREQLGFL